MARKTIKVKIPYSKPDEFISLAEKVTKKHEELGDSSPLLTLNKMPVFTGKLAQANGLRDESKRLRNQIAPLQNC